MRVLKLIMPALLALLALGMATTPIAAQDTGATDEGVDFEDIDGLQRAYSRAYTVDFMSMLDLATPGAEPTGWLGLTTLVMEFDSEEDAEAGLAKLNEEVTASDITGDGAEMQDVQLDIDLEHTASQAVVEEDGFVTNLMVVTAQDGTFVYAVVGVTLGDEPGDVVASMLTMMGEAESDGGEGTFSADGTSEGGAWAKLPTLEQVQELVPELVEVTDEVTFPTSAATPAA